MPQRLSEDIASVFNRGPAAKSILEVLTCYSGVEIHPGAGLFIDHGAGTVVGGRGSWLASPPPPQ